ncbi:hypothetical protein COOONC_17283 [Cooperia oncophora]
MFDIRFFHLALTAFLRAETLQITQSKHPLGVFGSYEFHAAGDLFVLVSFCDVHDGSHFAAVCPESSPRNNLQRSGIVSGRVGDIVLCDDDAKDDSLLDKIHIVNDRR